MKRGLMIVALAAAVLAGSASQAFAALTDREELGKDLFFDKNLSSSKTQACAACHAPSVGFTGPDSDINAGGAVYEGAVPGRFGNRKPPAAAYAGNSPILHYDADAKVWVGGMFWDGRATGDTLGDPLAEQAKGPFLNPLEQNLASPQAVIDIVKTSEYADLFEEVWGSGIWSDTNAAYTAVARSIASYERSYEVSPYSSKYDAYLDGDAKLTGAEKRGMKLFFGNAKCSGCHSGDDFTDYTYDNLGVPKNLMNPFYFEPTWNPQGLNWIDKGLGGYLASAGYSSAIADAEMGKQKVPTLRNVALKPAEKPGKFIKAYSHNGYFKSLKDIVHFYNTRDVPGAMGGNSSWPAPEVAENVNRTELGDLGLSDREEDDVVEFLKTLNDGFTE